MRSGIRMRQGSVFKTHACQLLPGGEGRNEPVRRVRRPDRGQFRPSRVEDRMGLLLIEKRKCRRGNGLSARPVKV
jgi:hypothetical protein